MEQRFSHDAQWTFGEEPQLDDNGPIFDMVSEPNDRVAARAATARAKQEQSGTANRTGDGDRLPAQLRSRMEHSFDRSFQDVRVHVNSAEAEGLGAKAFTKGGPFFSV